MTLPESELQRWIAYVFDHPVTEPKWHFDIDDDTEEPVYEPKTEALLYAETFERSDQLLQPFSSAQLHQGLNYLTSNSCSDHMFAMLDESVDEALRLRALRSFVPLFERTMAARCSPHLSHLDEPDADPLNSACYMWWDVLPFAPAPRDKKRRAFDTEALAVMERILAIPHDACRESALHGLGHWHYDYPKQTSAIIGRFLHDHRHLREELLDYARAARRGMVQ